MHHHSLLYLQVLLPTHEHHLHLRECANHCFHGDINDKIFLILGAYPWPPADQAVHP